MIHCPPVGNSWGTFSRKKQDETPDKAVQNCLKGWKCNIYWFGVFFVCVETLSSNGCIMGALYVGYSQLLGNIWLLQYGKI